MNRGLHKKFQYMIKRIEILFKSTNVILFFLTSRYIHFIYLYTLYAQRMTVS